VPEDSITLEPQILCRSKHAHMHTHSARTHTPLLLRDLLPSSKTVVKLAAAVALEASAAAGAEAATAMVTLATRQSLEPGQPCRQVILLKHGPVLSMPHSCTLRARCHGRHTCCVHNRAQLPQVFLGELAQQST